MKRYLVFSFDEFYPGGGWNDFVGAFDTIEEAHAVQQGRIDQIVDLTNGEVVYGDGMRGH